MATEQRVVELIIDASGVEAGQRRISAAYDHLAADGLRVEVAMAKATAAMERDIAILTNNIPRSADAIDAAVDLVRGKMDPVYRAQIRAQRDMTDALSVYNRAVLLGRMTEEEATRDILRLKQQQVEAINRVRDAQLMSDRVVAGANDNSARFRRQNAAYQYLDTAQSLYGGMSPAMVFAQQGPQLAQVYAGAGGLRTALADAAGMAGTLLTRLAPIAAVAAVGAGAIGTMRDNIAEASGESVTFGRVFSETIDVIKQDLSGIMKPVTDAFDFAFNYVGANLASAAVDIAEWLFKQFRAVYRDVAFLWNNFPDMLEGAFIGALNSVASFIDKSIEKVTGFINGLIERINQLPEWMGGGQGIKPIPGFGIGQIPNPAADRFDAANTAHIARQQEELAGSPIWDYLKSVYDRVLERVETNLPLVGPVPGKNPRRDLNAERDEDPILSAGRDRLRDLRQEVELFGLSGGAAAKARFEQEALNAAIEKHIELSPEQRAAINKDAEAYGELTDKLSRMRMMEDAQFELDQMFRGDREARIASQLKSYGMPVDLDGQNAAILRSIEIAKQYGDTWREVGDIGRSAIDQITDGMADGFKDFDDMAKSILGDINKEFLKLAIANPLKNAIFGDTETTLDNIGGVKGFFSALTGGKMPTDPALRSVSTMQVTAATVMVNGGVSGFGATDGVTRMHAAANGNDPFAAVMTGSDGTGANGGARSAWDFWKSKGLADHQVAGILGNIKAESAFNPLAVGDGGNAFGLYQHNDRRNNLFAAIGGKGNLSNALSQHEFAYSELMGPENRAWQALLASKDVRGATAAFAGFERPSGFSWANPEAAHNFTGRLAGAEEALKSFGGSVGTATQDLGVLGSGFGKVGNALSQVGIGASGKGSGGLFDNLLGGLGSMFGGVSPTSSFWAPNTTYSNWLMGRPGFARGTNGAPEGWSWVGEDGPELMRMRGGEVIRPHAQSRDMAANAGRQSVKREFNIINPPPGYQADVEEEEDEYGNEKVNVTFSKAMSREMGRTGSPANKTLRALGAKPRRKQL